MFSSFYYCVDVSYLMHSFRELVLFFLYLLLKFYFKPKFSCCKYLGGFLQIGDFISASTFSYIFLSIFSSGIN
jgi:hypothetical protein